MAQEVLVDAQNLTKTFKASKGSVQAVTDVSLKIYKGETLALVGESGCGKSTLGRLLLRLIEPDSGTINFSGTELTKLKKKELRAFRRNMQLIFQDPYASLDPRFTIEKSICEPLRAAGYSQEEQHAMVLDLAEKTGINPDHLNRYPHQFSGGQRQRVGIARAIALNPQLVVCDEPVSALDVSIQAQTLKLLKQLQQELQLTYLFISHDLSVVHYISNRVCVMFLGRICEIGTTEEIYYHPKHPYTRYLLSATPQIGKKALARDELLTGEIPSPINPPSGCRFRTRCPYATEKCAREMPSLTGDDAHQVACHYPQEFEMNV